MMMSNYSVNTTIAQLDAAVIEGLNEIGKVIEQDAKAAAPVDTGRLRDSITFEVSGKEVTVGSSVEYAPYQEAKKHFLENAVNKNSSYIENIMADKMK